MDYITIDFETANSNNTSACSLGIVVVRNNKIEEELHYLINPMEDFLEYNIDIHHITPMDVQNEDTFKELWPKIKHLFMDSYVYAHNAGFDISVLKALIEKYELEMPRFKWGCTLKIARKLWNGELANNKLGTIAQFLELDHDYHNALSDALVCVAIINRGQRIMRVDSHLELYDALAIRYGGYSSEKFYGTYNKYNRNKKVEITKNKDLNDKVVYLAGKPSKITRNELKNKLAENGAYVERNINLSLDYFVILGSAPKSSLEKLDNLNGKGRGINIIDEDTILGMIK
ncbi:MAG: exonuclease domain-containing protein [Bacilli bacterium]